MTTSQTFARYRFGNNPSAVQLTDSPAPWDDDLVRAAGFDPGDDEVTISQLAEPWERHPAGALVVVGLTLPGYPFAVQVQKPVATADMGADELRSVVDATGISDNATARAEIAALAVELECTEQMAIVVFEETADATIDEIATPWYRMPIDYWRRELDSFLRDGWQ